jgi:hypothetical protein
MLSVLAILLTATSTAPSSEVELRLDDCIQHPDLVHDLVQIELGHDPGASPRRVHVECREQAVVIRIEPNPTGLLERTVLRSDVITEGGPRLIALNIVELVQESEPRGSTPTPRPSAAPVITEPRPPRARPWIGAAPTMRVRPGPNGVAIGGLLKIGLDAASTPKIPWALQVDGGFEQASASVALGSTHLQAVHGAIQAGLGFRIAERWRLSTLIGARGGWAWIEGETADFMSTSAAKGDGFWWGPIASVRARHGRTLGFSLGLEGGWTARPIYGRVPEGIVGQRDGWLGFDVTIDWGADD